MKHSDRVLADCFAEKLVEFHRDVRSMPGIQELERRNVFIGQLIESLHRVQYVSVIRTRDVSPRRADPNDLLFDPVKAAILHQQNSEIDEAFWCVFLFVHFGKHLQGGYRYAREVYGRLGNGGRWDWLSVSADPISFSRWLEQHKDHIRRPGVPGGFGNHRRYESLDHTSAVVESYVAWVRPPRTHAGVVQEVLDLAEGDTKQAFDLLYRSMKQVKRFGRTARFDYLTMVGKLDLAPIEPGSLYLEGATGPYAGAQLLFGKDTTALVSRQQVDLWLVELGEYLNVGMQVLEDALCNWQKSPDRFVAFRG